LHGWLKQKVSSLGETNHRPIACHQYKARRHCTHYVPSFLALAFSFSIAFTIYCSMADTTARAPASHVVASANTDDSGHDSGMESTAMATSSSLTHGTAKMAEWEIPELTDFFKKTTVTEDDRRAYHDRGWLTDNLVSFIPEVDVPTIDGSTIICFESQLVAGLGLPPNKFLSSIMNYLGCSLVHFNPNVVSALSSFVMLCECWLGIPPYTSLFYIITLLPDTPRPSSAGLAFSRDASAWMNTSRLPLRAARREPNRGGFLWICMTNPRGLTSFCSLQLSRISGLSHR
jgi:hypothetical protein